MIIKQSVVDVLMFLFERYLDDDAENENTRVTDERDSIQLRLEEMGFHNQEINQAFDWLEDLAEIQADIQDKQDFISIKETSNRIYSEQEKKLITVESIGFLNFLEQSNILNSVTRELILDRVIALGHPLDAEQLKWIIMIVLHTQPGEENALAIMEDFILVDWVSVEEIDKANNFNVYPNPGTGLFIIEFDEKTDETVSIEVADYTGKLIKKIETSKKNQTYKLDLSDENNGVYMVSVKSKESTVIKKLSLIK
jgi:Smg protein